MNLVAIFAISTLIGSLIYYETTVYEFHSKRRQLNEVTEVSIEKTIRVGILHSLTGTMSISENSVVDATLFAIQEINEAGGILGKQIEAVLYDGASDWPNFASNAQKLIDFENVSVVFGCWTSASRKAVLPIFEIKKHLLFYPVQYEGQECSKNIFYTGAAPNQQIEPAVTWLNEKYPRQDFFLIGSDYVFPRTANAIIKAMVSKLGLRSMEQYIPLGNSQVDSVFDNIKRFLPNGGIIFNTLNGDSNVAFFLKFRQLMSLEKYHTMSVSITETEIRDIGVDVLKGHYAAWNYFMTVENEINRSFLEKFKSKYGVNTLVTDPMESAYIGVHIWSQAVKQAGMTNIPDVEKAAMGQIFQAPQGKNIRMGESHHLDKYVRIGEVASNGLFNILFEDSEPRMAIPWNRNIEATKDLVCDHTKE